MCGRFVRYRHPRDVAGALGVAVVECDLGPSWNIAPRQPVAVVLEDGVRKLVGMRWGLVPGWATAESVGDKLINARSETVAEKPSFRDAFRHRRCLIVADGFYEWKVAGGAKTPMFITPEPEGPFCMAGLYERRSAADGSVVTTCTIVTTEANKFMRAIHHRMPVIVAEQNHGRWLDPATPPGELAELMMPYDGAMKAHPVSPAVNRAAFNDPSCIAPYRSPEPTQGELFVTG